MPKLQVEIPRALHDRLRSLLFAQRSERSNRHSPARSHELLNRLAVLEMQGKLDEVQALLRAEPRTPLATMTDLVATLLAEALDAREGRDPPAPAPSKAKPPPKLMTASETIAYLKEKREAKLAKHKPKAISTPPE